jgi:hypothetical protein
MHKVRKCDGHALWLNIYNKESKGTSCQLIVNTLEQFDLDEAVANKSYMGKVKESTSILMLTNYKELYRMG